MSVEEHGPFFSGPAFEAVMKDVCDQVQDDVASAALERVQFYLNAQIKHPTPYYETQIIKETANRQTVVHDRGIVYGPWLEGTSSRNTRTRFKGYASFRKAASDVEQTVPDIVARVLGRNLPRLEGHP